MRTTTAHLGRQLSPWAWTVGLALLLAVPSPAKSAGQCSSSKAASELVSCGHCQVLKELMRGTEGSNVEFEVFELHHGVVIQLTGSSKVAVTMIQDLVDDIWIIHDDEETAATSHYCPDCAERMDKLGSAERDRALTDTGAVVVLTSEDQEVVAWLRQDALQYQGWLQTADSSH